MIQQKLQSRRKRQDILKVMEVKSLRSKLIYLAITLFKTDGEIKSFTDKQKLRDFSTTKPALQQMQKRHF